MSLCTNASGGACLDTIPADASAPFAALMRAFEALDSDAYAVLHAPPALDNMKMLQSVVRRCTEVEGQLLDYRRGAQATETEKTIVRDSLSRVADLHNVAHEEMTYLRADLVCQGLDEAEVRVAFGGERSALTAAVTAVAEMLQDIQTELRLAASELGEEMRLFEQVPTVKLSRRELGALTAVILQEEIQLLVCEHENCADDLEIVMTECMLSSEDGFAARETAQLSRYGRVFVAKVAIRCLGLIRAELGSIAYQARRFTAAA